MNLLRIALRNLGRKKARTFLSLLSIAVGVFVVLVAKGWVDGMLDQIVESTVNFSSGHIRVVHEEYPLREQLLSLNYTVGTKEAEVLGDLPGVAAVTPRVRFGALVSRDEDTEGVMVSGIRPEWEDPVSGMSRYLTGRWMGEGEREAVVGARLLRTLGLTVGDRFTLVFSSAFGSLKGVTLDVVGRLDSGYMYLDERHVFVDLALAQTMLELDDEVTEILVIADNQRAVADLLGQVEEVVSGPLLAIPWYSHSELINYLNIARFSYVMIYLIILAMASFVVINTMVMVVNERIREIGMLGALGLSPGQIMRMFFYEGVIIGVAGSFIGAVFGGAVLFIANRVGIAVFDPSTLDAEFFLTPRLFPAFNLPLVIYAVVLGIVVTAVAVWLPSRQAARLEPTHALRGNV